MFIKLVHISTCCLSRAITTGISILDWYGEKEFEGDCWQTRARCQGEGHVRYGLFAALGDPGVNVA